jgi:hypothetical protein
MRAVPSTYFGHTGDGAWFEEFLSVISDIAKG